MGYCKRDQVLAVAIVFTILSWTTVALRIWVRAGMLKSFGRDDWAMLVTQLTFTVYLVCQFGGFYYGTGQHLSELEPWAAQRALSFWFFCEVFYTLSTVLLKVAIGFFLLRVATNRIHIWIIRVVMVSTVICGGGFFFVILLQCWPMRAWWTLDPTDGKCLSWTIMAGFAYSISALNVIADWTFGILPAFVVKDLVMSRRQKVLVSCILAFAAVGSTATLVRLPFIGTLQGSYLGWNGDFLYDSTGLAIWTTVEVGIGITAGCIATLRPLLQLVLVKLGISSSQHLTSRRSRSRNIPTPSPGLRLDGLKGGHGVTTTITCQGVDDHDDIENQYSWHTRNSSQERLGPVDNIMKQVVVEYDEVDSISPPPSSMNIRLGDRGRFPQR